MYWWYNVNPVDDPYLLVKLLLSNKQKMSILNQHSVQTSILRRWAGLRLEHNKIPTVNEKQLKENGLDLKKNMY